MHVKYQPPNHNRTNDETCSISQLKVKAEIRPVEHETLLTAYKESYLLKSFFLLISFGSSNLIAIYCQRVKLQQHIYWN